VYVLEVRSLSVVEGQALLSKRHLQGDATAWASLVARYSGNGLALKIVGETIDQVFGGDIAAFLEQSGSSSAFGGIRRLLDTQVERLSTLERDVLRWLGIEREPVTFSELVADMGPAIRRGDVLEAVDALRGRSLVERREPGTAFTLQSAVLGYVTDRLVDRCADEIQRGELVLLATHPIVKAQAKDYVRQSQERLIAEPLLARLLAAYGSRRAVEQRLMTVLDQVRRTPKDEHRGAPGNLVNLLRLLRGDLRGVDLSGLEIHQVYLQEVVAQDASLQNSHLSEAVLGEAFNYPTCVALSADGTILASGVATGEVCVWRVADRALVATLRGHASLVQGVALNADGRLVASASNDGSVRLWEAPSGRPLVTLPGHTGGAMSVALSQDGRLVASGGYDGTVRLWKAPGGQLLTTISGHSGGVRGIALSADGRLVASGSMDRTVRVWEADSGRLLTLLQGHTSGVRGVALSGDGHVVVSGSEDGTVRLWEAETGGLLETLQGHTGGVWSVALTQDGRTLASSSEDGTVRLWDAASGHLQTTLAGHTAGAWGVALSRDGRLVASSSFEGMVRLWDAERPTACKFEGADRRSMGRRGARRRPAGG
jgi:DNA-binding beta-propeller fold protein YncE